MNSSDHIGSHAMVPQNDAEYFGQTKLNMFESLVVLLSDIAEIVVVVPGDNSSCLCSHRHGTIVKIYGQLYFVGEPVQELTVQLTKKKENSNIFLNEAFQHKRLL